jgi:cytochrome c
MKFSICRLILAVPALLAAAGPAASAAGAPQHGAGARAAGATVQARGTTAGIGAPSPAPGSHPQPSAAEPAPPSAGDAERGARLFRQCAACLSTEPGRHLTGPSLAKVWGRKAGTAEGFGRYSDALKQSGVAWNEHSLDDWLKNPGAFLPGNLMNFPGVKDEKPRRDLIAYLRAVSEGKRISGGRRAGGMMAGPQMLRLREEIEANSRVKAIRYCGDTYHVTTEAGKTHPFWEFNLRFKTDSSRDGPAPGRPALIPSGMMGDRAFVVFANPRKFNRFIEAKCE